ncbi:MAG TPA: class I SAM-dependent methyltransferase [Actinomycetota bacterium]
MSEHEEPTDCCFDEWATHAARRARTHEVGSRITATLVDALADAGLSDRTLLDVGCGGGDLALAALARGATHATGFDLGPGAIAEARRLAAERGLASRASFEVGDGAELALPGADVVSLNRVLCCYPRVDALLENTLGATGLVYGFTAPIDRGLRGVLNRVLNTLGNGWYALRPAKFRGFRGFVHDLGAVDLRVRAAGFEPVRRERHGLWDLAVYARP